MDKNLNQLMDSLGQGVLILNQKYRIVYVNKFFCKFMGKRDFQILHCTLYEVLPNFHASYLSAAFSDALKKNCHFFFSAAMHKNLVPCKEKFNITVSGLVYEDEKYLFLEFINVTSEFERIRQLKADINRLFRLNQELLKKEKEIQQLAYYDTLTGVANRVLFYEIAKRFMQSAERNHETFCLMFIDIDNFKNINDTYGHETGDRVLKKVAGLLTGAVRKSDLVARYGGDEFLVLLSNIKAEKNYKIVASKITAARDNVADFDGNKIKISFSVGASFFPKDGNTLDQLIRKSDHSMYMAKKSQKGTRVKCRLRRCRRPVQPE